MPNSSKRERLDESTLILTQIIFRHGHRYPDQIAVYKGDPYANEKYLPFGKGELTLIGRKQSLCLGKSFRRRYSNLLEPDYVDGIIDAKSSGLSRARTTLQLVLAGLFPPLKSTQIDDHLNWQPIPFTYKPIHKDKLIGRSISNMYFHQDHPDFRKTSNSQEIIKCLEKELNWPIKTQAQILIVFDTIRCQADIGLEIPKWANDIYPMKLLQEVKDFMQHNLERKEFIVNGHGDFIKEINDVMVKKTKEFRSSVKTMPKMFLYSGHDINIAGVLSIFKQFDAAKWPNYTANISFELHNVDGQFYVRILYQNGPSNARDFMQEPELVAIKLPKSIENVCTLEEFSDYVKEYFAVPKNKINPKRNGKNPAQTAIINFK